MKIAILHPFTPEAVGLDEHDFLTFHSQPQFKAFQMLVKNYGYDCSLEYFTSKRKKYSLFVGNVQYNFYPVKYKWNGDHKKWKKQSSTSCLKQYQINAPDVTFIYMSGHSSPFSFQLSKNILENKKQYIAMLGGMHYTDNERNRVFYKSAHHLLVLTHSQKAEMEKLELFKDLDIRVFPLGVDTSVFTPISRQKSFPALLFLGRILEWKKIHLAIEAIHKLVKNGFPESQLHIVGTVSSQTYYLQLKDMVKTLGLENNITFLRQVKHTELPQIYRKADLLMLPSFTETFGMVMIESMACGTPVAAINYPGGPAEVIVHGKDGILTSPEKYCDEVLAFFQNWEKGIKMASNAREKVEKEYSIKATYKVINESITSALN